MWRPQTKEAVLREVRIREWRTRVWQQTKATLIWCWQNLRKGTAMASRWLKERTAVTAHEIELSQLLSQRHDKLLQLGERAYALYRTGSVSWQALEPLCEEIAQLDERLEREQTLPLQLIPDDQPQPFSATGS